MGGLFSELFVFKVVPGLRMLRLEAMSLIDMV